MSLAANILNLVDFAKRLDPDGKTADIAELLKQKNEVLIDMPWVEGNLPTGHRTSVRTGLPTAAWRALNAGTVPTKSTTAQIDEGCGMLEAWSEVDEEVAKLNGNVQSFRLSEAMAFIEAMNQEMAGTLFYGNSLIDIEEFSGLSIRYSDLDATNGQNIINGGGSGGDNTSIWLVAWGAQTVHGIFPKGSKAGLQHDDYGLETVESTAGIGGSRLRAYRERWQWKCGIALRDWRYAVRGCNIDVSDLIAKSSNADIIEMMIKMIHRLPNEEGKRVFYMNRTVFQMLDIYRRLDVMAGGQLSYTEVDGKMTYAFRGIPIRICDQLLNSEAVVTT